MKYFLYCLKHYADFNGRARRSEYWFFTLVHSLLVILPIIIGLVMIVTASLTQLHHPASEAPRYGNVGVFIIFIFALLHLALFIPQLAVSVRRLHDTDKSGFFILIAFIPYVGVIGGIVLLVFYCMDSTPGYNQYGPNPKGIGNEEGAWRNPYGQPPYGQPGYGATCIRWTTLWTTSLWTVTLWRYVCSSAAPLWCTAITTRCATTALWSTTTVLRLTTTTALWQCTSDTQQWGRRQSSTGSRGQQQSLSTINP